MGDIVERLRNACTGKVATTAWPHRLLHDAADEIEKCWENINIKADWIDATINDMAEVDQHVTALEEENKRLRKKIDVLCRVVIGYQDSLHPMVQDQIDRTRAALSPVAPSSPASRRQPKA